MYVSLRTGSLSAQTQSLGGPARSLYARNATSEGEQFCVFELSRDIMLMQIQSTCTSDSHRSRFLDSISSCLRSHMWCHNARCNVQTPSNELPVYKKAKKRTRLLALQITL